MILLDIAWASSFAVLAIISIFSADTFWSIRQIPFLLLIIWSLRLSSNLLLKMLKGRKDERYEMLKKSTDNWAQVKFLLFFFEAFLIIFLFIPFFYLFFAKNIEPSGWFFWGVFLFLLGVIGEILADKQLQSFKQNRQENETVCQNGLWHYSRHPNYFFECLIWASYFFLALGLLVNLSWLDITLLLISPTLMVTLLCFITGIPPLEKLAVEKKGKVYQDYQKTTSALIPWFPKNIKKEK